jgi:4-hydroxy-2-oxoglutarate aldolase
VSLTLKGVLGPVVTTFQAANGELDPEAFARNVRAHIDAGMHGIVVTGSTGEAALLDERERTTLVDAARKQIPRDRLLIVGTGAESTRTTQRNTRLAAEHGADAVLVVAPHYYGAKAMTHAALAAHYATIADTSPVPVVLYNIPKYMHFALPPALVAELARHENIVGIKDSSGDLNLLGGYLEAQSGSFSVLTGNGATFKRALEMGARGGILAVGLIATNLALEVYTAMSQGTGSSVDQVQDRLGTLSTRVVSELGVPGVKAALDRIGLTGGPVRPPLQPLAGEDLGRIAELLRQAELSLAA